MIEIFQEAQKKKVKGRKPKFAINQKKAINGFGIPEESIENTLMLLIDIKYQKVVVIEISSR